MSVKVFKNKRGRGIGYTVQVHVPIPGDDPYRKTKTLPIREKAKAWGDADERRVYAELATGTFGKVGAAIPTLAEFLPEFIEKYARAENRKPSYIATLEDLFRVHLLPAFGHLKLDAIEERAVQAFKRAKTSGGDGRKPLKAKTLNNLLSPLRLALRKAVDWKYIERLPCEIREVKAKSPEMSFYDARQLARVVEAARARGDIAHLIVLLGAHAGLRSGEMAALRWINVDLEGQGLFVRESEWQGQVGATKGWEDRYVPLSADLVTALRDRRRRTLGPRVLENDHGEPLTRNAVRSRLRVVAREAGVKHGVHILRHTCASLMLMDNVPVPVVQRLLGHQNVSTLLRYAHLTDQAKRDAVATFNRTPSATVAGGATGVQQPTA